MKLFKYNPKTQSFEYRIKDSLDADHIKTLLAAQERKCLTWEILEELFPENRENQARHDSTFHLSDLGLIEYKHDHSINDGFDTVTYQSINPRKVSGYFLTQMGKSFVNSLLPKEKQNKRGN